MVIVKYCNKRVKGWASFAFLLNGCKTNNDFRCSEGGMAFLGGWFRVLDSIVFLLLKEVGDFAKQGPYAFRVSTLILFFGFSGLAK